MESARIQTVLRLPPELMDRVRRNARKQKCSFNSYVERILDQATESHFPSIPDDFQVGAEIAGMGIFDFVEPSADDLSADPKLAYLWQKYGKS